MSVVIRVRRGQWAAELPAYATSGSAGMDLRACEALTLEPGEWGSVGTGLFLEIPEGYEGQVRPRSGLAAKQAVTVLNSPGTIDSDYRGEVRVILINHGRESFRAAAGDRIAQIVFAPVTQVRLCESEELSQTERDEGGFGSTGAA